MERNIMSTRAIVVLAVVGMAMLAFAQAKKPATVFCKYCGYRANSVSTLTASSCIRHPAGPHKGRHALYEGSAKEKYVCKHCGYKAGSIATLTGSSCIRHPNGPHKGRHEPAL